MKVYHIAVVFIDRRSHFMRHYGNLASAMEVATDYVKRSDIVANRIWSIGIELYE